MTAFVLGAIILGSISSWLMAFVPFLFAVVVALLIGVGAGLAADVSLSAIALPGLLLLVTAQLAYGLGLLIQFALSRLTPQYPPHLGSLGAALARDERHGHDSPGPDPAHRHVR